MGDVPTIDQIRELANQRIKKIYTQIMQAKEHKQVNLLQTAYGLALWKNIIAKNCIWNDLNATERFEVKDALSKEK